MIQGPVPAAGAFPNRLHFPSEGPNQRQEVRHGVPKFAAVVSRLLLWLLRTFDCIDGA
jgi:hypothetical protein